MNEPHADLAEQRDPSGSLLAAVSNAMVRLFKEQFGRGPNRVRSHFAGPDTIVCVLENSFTPAERKLVEMGEHQRLRDIRMFFQAATEDQFRSAVEEVVGRPVRAFMSAIDAKTDTAVEIFLFEPDSSGDR